MRILFAVKPHLPAIGGAQLTVHWLALGLQRRGHEVAVLGGLSPYPEQRAAPPAAEAVGAPDALALQLAEPVDRSHGYPLVASDAPERLLPAMAAAFEADVVVVGAYNAGRAPAARLLLRAAAPRPTVLHVHDAGGTPLAEERELGIAAAVAVSEHVRELVQAHGMDALVSLPPVERSYYRVASARRTALFVNPVPQKGVERALALASARPDVPFAFRLAWHIEAAELPQLRARLRQLPNVALLPRTLDPAELYGDARLLLAPSPYPEAWGRVVSEAQASGIPALVACSGGLPEAVGAGGLVIPSEASDAEWLVAFNAMWDDTATYQRLAAAAEREGRRPELTVDHATAVFEQALERAVMRISEVA